MCDIKSYNKCAKSSLSALTQTTIALPVVYCPVDDMLFEVNPEIRCSGVPSRYCCYGNHAAGSKPILFITSSTGFPLFMKN